jgi:hypothetical protein
MTRYLLCVHGSRGQHRFFREETEKIRPLRDIRVQEAPAQDFEETEFAMYAGFQDM